MVLPLGDENRPGRITPVVNFLLIGLNVFVFVFLQQFGSDEKFTYSFSCVPQEIVTGKDIVTKDEIVEDPISGTKYTQPGLRRTPVSDYITLITSMFMHGGIV